MSAERYARQVRFGPVGTDGQRRIRSARVLILGCGALGSALAEQLTRIGVGHLRVVDRDFVEPSNLARQSLFTEADAAGLLPKAIAAAERLHAINGEVAIEPRVVHVDAGNVVELIADCDLALDGADNFAVRHLLNEACCRQGTPWIHGACVGAYGLSLPILPGEGPCLRCLQDELPAAGDGPSCESAGVIAPIVQLVAAWQAAEALKLLVGDRAAVRRDLWACDLWHNRFQSLACAGARDPHCRACSANADFPALAAGPDPAVALCGREGVQITRPGRADLAAAATSLGQAVDLANDFLLRWSDRELRGTLFADGRVIVQGTADPDRARAWCDRYLG